MLWFLLLFVVAPLFELYVLLGVGAIVGPLPAILLSILTAVIGGILARAQGLSVLLRVRAMLENGEQPALEMLEGALLLLAGLALLLPGFVTDALGFLLLIPPLRRALIRHYLPLQPGTIPVPQPGVQVIEAEYRRED